jgi:hypothetical protein
MIEEQPNTAVAVHHNHDTPHRWLPVSVVVVDSHTFYFHLV